MLVILSGKKTFRVTVSSAIYLRVWENLKPAFSYLVPSRSPISMRVRSTGAHSILIEWSPVPRQYVHGVLRGYHVYYRAGRPMIKRSVSQMGVIKAVSVNKSIQSVEITSLEPFTPYDVWVSAYTAVGSGPPSRPVTVTTDEDGMFITLI